MGGGRREVGGKREGGGKGMWQVGYRTRLLHI